MTTKQMLRLMLIAAVLAAAVALGLIVTSLGAWVRITGGADPVSAWGHLMAVALIVAVVIGFYHLFRS